MFDLSKTFRNAMYIWLAESRGGSNEKTNVCDLANVAILCENKRHTCQGQ